MNANNDVPDTAKVRKLFMDLQDEICDALASTDGVAHFSTEEYREPKDTLQRPRVMADGPIIEKAAVQFTHARGAELPPATTNRNPHLAGKPFEALSISLIVHPRNPHAPTSHMNLRLFVVHVESVEASWHFGGGFDLTPCYGYEEDARHFHAQARAACQPFGADIYPRFKKWCDEYFYLPHRGETRGIGGLFFDDWNAGGFAASLALVHSIGIHFLPAYLPILERRKNTPHSQREREFQLYRRGRYAEFNLALDRGTRYGLQSGRRIESVLASLPPVVTWKYNWQPQPGSREEELYTRFLSPREWLTD